MKGTGLCSLALAGFFAFAAQSMAQPAIIVEPLSQPAVTTGMVGLTTNQTARLSVLNLNSTTSTTPTTANNCTVELQFFDGQNKSLKQALVPNFAPQTATTLDLTRAAITTQTGNRAEIRGEVTINPASTPVAGAAVPGYCTVFTTLQIFDETTGSTVVLTSDTRVTNSGPVAIPLIVQR
ncbi:MAG: hypothetical protein ABSB88_02115 [Bryobacteraceae bacterium]|jgi:hypothetical protein